MAAFAASPRARLPWNFGHRQVAEHGDHALPDRRGLWLRRYGTLPGWRQGPAVASSRHRPVSGQSWINLQSQQCLENDGYGQGYGNLHTAPCNSSSSQGWIGFDTFPAPSAAEIPGSLRTNNVQTGLCLDSNISVSLDTGPLSGKAYAQQCTVSTGSGGFPSIHDLVAGRLSARSARLRFRCTSASTRSWPHLRRGNRISRRGLRFVGAAGVYGAGLKHAGLSDDPLRHDGLPPSAGRTRRPGPAAATATRAPPRATRIVATSVAVPDRLLGPAATPLVEAVLQLLSK